METEDELALFIAQDVRRRDARTVHGLLARGDEADEELLVEVTEAVLGSLDETDRLEAALGPSAAAVVEVDHGADLRGTTRMSKRRNHPARWRAK